MVTYRIPVPSEDSNKYGCFNKRYVLSGPYRIASIQAVKEKLIMNVAHLLHETDRHNGYPSCAVSVALSECQDALLLLEQVERELDTAARPVAAVVGRVRPAAAEAYLERAQLEILDKRLIDQAQQGKTHWFKGHHWDRLRAIRPDLAPATAGELNVSSNLCP